MEKTREEEQKIEYFKERILDRVKNKDGEGLKFVIREIIEYGRRIQAE